MVTGGVGEQIDLLLSDLMPLAVAEVVAHLVLQTGETIDNCGHGRRPYLVT
jgi:hypothetical protein